MNTASNNYEHPECNITPFGCTTSPSGASTSAQMNKPDPWSKRRCHLDGIALDLYNYILGACGCHQPKFAEAATLTTLGALLGRGVKNASGLRSNLFTLAIGHTSAGKDDYFGIIQKVMKALGRDQRILAGSMKSEAALEKTLGAFPVRLLLLEEVGHFFGTLKKSNGGSNGYLMTVMPALTKLWSAANRDHQMSTRATPTEGCKEWSGPTILHQPCLSIYGTSSPQPLFSNLNTSDLEDGSLSRYIGFISRSREPFCAKDEAPVPDELVRKLDHRLLALGLSRQMYETGTDRQNLPNEALVIPHTDGAKFIMKTFEDLKTEKLRMADDGDSFEYLWSKARENAERIALIFACFRSANNPVIDEYAAEYAVELMILSVNEMIDAARSNIGKNKTARDREAILGIIRRAGTKGCTLTTICRKTQTMKRSDRFNILDELEECGDIEHKTFPSGGSKPTHMYFYTSKDN